MALFEKPNRVSLQTTVGKTVVVSTGLDKDYGLAALKARSELMERIYTSDLMNEDITGLFTYLKPSFWCSTGAAAHPDRDICLENSMAELIERDMVACWLSMSRVYSSLTTVEDIELIEIPCMYKDWHVVVSIRKEDNKTQYQSGASKNLEEAMYKAFNESFLRNHLDDRFVAKRLPEIAEGPIQRGSIVQPPNIFLREWKVNELYITKYYGYHMADFRRGVPELKINEYKTFIGQPECVPLRPSRTWFH